MDKRTQGILGIKIVRGHFEGEGGEKKMKYEKHTIRVSKGPDFIMVDLLSPDGKTATSTEVLGAIVLSKRQWKELKKFVGENPNFEEDLRE